MSCVHYFLKIRVLDINSRKLRVPGNSLCTMPPPLHPFPSVLTQIGVSAVSTEQNKTIHESGELPFQSTLRKCEMWATHFPGVGPSLQGVWVAMGWMRLERRKSGTRGSGGGGGSISSSGNLLPLSPSLCYSHGRHKYI